MNSENRLADWQRKALTTEAAINKAIIGQESLVRLIAIALFARGHVLLEGDVGVGKTTVLRAFARAMGGQFERTEGTIDLMPNDLIYHTYVDADGQPRIDPGPLLRHGEHLTTFFFNEINRARPQVQSLLLRAMAERSVSAFNREYRFPHMTVFADRNRVEREETFELAAAARDRFMLELGMVAPADEETRRALIIDTVFHDADALIESVPHAVCPGEQLNDIAGTIQQSVRTSRALEKYLLELWRASESPVAFGVSVDNVDMDRLVLAGASPRGMSALVRAARVVAWINERDHVVPEDVRSVLPAALGHRVFFNPVYELRRSTIAPAYVTAIMNVVASP